MARKYRNYDPRKDSSPSQALRTDDHTGPILVVHEGECPCGCGELPKGKKAHFAMGHDARYRGKLLRAHVAGVPVTRYLPIGSGEDVTKTAREWAAEYEWEHYLDAAKLREDLREQERVDRANKRVIAEATGPQVGDKKLIKVGRWEYTGQVVAIFDDGDTIEYQYATKSGDVKRHRVAKADAA